MPKDVLPLILDKKPIEDAHLESIMFTEILLQQDLERVSPKLEAWRNHYTYKIAEGGRGAGAKTWSAASLLVQKYNYSKVQRKCLCVREFMNSLAESSYAILSDTIKRLRYPDWVCTREYITNKRNGSYFIFRGLRDLKRAEQLKSYEGFDDVFADEAAGISLDSWATLIPTLRKEGREIWVLYNRDLEVDPCHDYFVLNMRPNTSYFHLEPGSKDNPWWDKTTLPEDMEADYKRDPDEAEHIWEGLPRKQGIRAVMSRVLIRQAMDRNLILEEIIGEEKEESEEEETEERSEGAEEIGADIARFGDDKTEMYRRKGMKVIAHKEMKKADTKEVAFTIWNFADRNPEIPIKVDVGYNPGVVDELSYLGAYVIPVNFGGTPLNPDKYPNVASEMWFDFPIEEADIPNDQELMIQLSTRWYGYDKKGRRQVESKDEYKKRQKSSPDKADALLLTFYEADRKVSYRPSGYGLGDLGM